MATLTRKQQEIQERERQIVAVARKLFRQHGYLGFNMDRIAQEMQYAKGTIYQHFRCKEDVILAMAVETLVRRASMFEQASLFRGKPRERMAAIGCAAELFVKWYPDHFELEKVLSCQSIIQKTSEKLQNSKTGAEMRCISLVGGIVRDGIVQGDLSLRPDVTPDHIVFGLWSNTFGGYSIMDSEATMGHMGINDGFQMVRDNNNRMLDGFGWRPFSQDHDYNRVFDQVEREIFSDGPIPG